MKRGLLMLALVGAVALGAGTRPAGAAAGGPIVAFGAPLQEKAIDVLDGAPTTFFCEAVTTANAVAVDLGCSLRSTTGWVIASTWSHTIGSAAYTTGPVVDLPIGAYVVCWDVAAAYALGGSAHQTGCSTL